MNRRTVLLALTVAACGTSPDPTLYTLTARAGPVQQTRALAVELRRIGLAGYLDRSAIVRATVQNRLRVADFDRWGEPLGRMIERVLTENLVERLPNASVFSEAGAISTRPDLVLEIDIQRFDPDANGTLILLAQLALRRDGTNATATTLRLTRPIPDATVEAQVAAMSDLLGDLADKVATAIAATR